MAAAIELSPEIAAELDRFEEQVRQYLAGELDEEIFRPIRLTNGVYGVRQGGNQQMLRVKVPQGRLDADQLDVLGRLAGEYGRGFGHITTRQNVQFHFVPLSRCPEAMRLVASVGLTTREACGNTVRNVVACPLAGGCPGEAFDVTPWARAVTDHLLRHPMSQRLPRKFKISFSGCDTDCGQGSINDIGCVATVAKDGRRGFRLVFGGALGTTPYAAQVLEPFTPFEDLMITVEAVLRVFDRTGNRNNSLRARMKWVLMEIGPDQFREMVLKERDMLRSVVGERAPHGIPQAVRLAGDAAFSVPESTGGMSAPGAGGRPERIDAESFEVWRASNTFAERDEGRFAAVVSLLLGDLTRSQFEAAAEMARRFGSGDVRLTNRQNLVVRGLAEGDLEPLYDHLQANGMGMIGAERIRDVVACPGADTCNLGVTQSRGLAKAIGKRLEAEGLADLAGIRVNISGCPNSCGQHHIADIGFSGMERRIGGNSAPGYQLYLAGGLVGEEKVEFGTRAGRVGAKRAPEVVVALVKRYLGERLDGEAFSGWCSRKGPKEVAASVEEIGTPGAFSEAPSEYIDWDEDEQFQVNLGRGECAS